MPAPEGRRQGLLLVSTNTALTDELCDLVNVLLDRHPAIEVQTEEAYFRPPATKKAHAAALENRGKVTPPG